MKALVFWTGIISIVSGVALQFPAISGVLLPTEQLGMLMHLFGLTAMFLGTMLIFSSRDLAHRGTLVMWEGVLRLGGFALMAGYGLTGGGAALIGSGLFDGIIGLLYLIGLPRTLGTTFTALLLDSPAPLTTLRI